MPSSRLQRRRNWMNAAAAAKHHRSASGYRSVAANAAPARHPKTRPATETPLGDAPALTSRDASARAHQVERDVSGRRSTFASAGFVGMRGRGYRWTSSSGHVGYRLLVDTAP